MLLSPCERLASLPQLDKDAFLEQLSNEQASQLIDQWEGWLARPAQERPTGAWTYWLVMAGRGFGKTRTGAETVRAWIKEGARYVNLIGATADDARDIMVEGESGILSVCSRVERPEYVKHASKLVWPNGATSLIFTADKPDRLRGKQHEKLWADELAAWRYLESWDQAKFGLRLGKNPQAIVTTTPRPLKALIELSKDPDCVVTRGSTYDNKANLADGFFSTIIKKYEGTRMGRQELLAELLDDMPGALWSRKNIDELRKSAAALPEMKRIVVGVDPAITNTEGSDESGIITGGLGVDGHGYVWGDDSGRYSPKEWAHKAVSRFLEDDADLIVAEVNQGGDMVEQTIRTENPNINVKKVTASRGKVTRAEPISALYEQGRIHHVGRLDTLEDQMCAFTSDFDRKAQGYSPDRVDALVWMLTELFPSITKKEVAKRPSRHRHASQSTWMSA